ncbi:MAG: cytochrome c oxidase accessory protein CcoG, partial [Gallionellaceae bacterium]|nr:cytochrome c oxidase accessory protein CcoG [Gallionellaceae bacterium]
GGIKDQIIVDGDQKQVITKGKASTFTVFVRAREENIRKEVTEIIFRVENTEDPAMTAEYHTVFNGPKRE